MLTDIPQTAAPAETTNPYIAGIARRYAMLRNAVPQLDAALDEAWRAGREHGRGDTIPAASAPTLAAEVATLRERNAELEKALRDIVNGIDSLDDDGGMDRYFPQVKAARALLAKEG